jgi:signal transduction histidine kinase
VQEALTNVAKHARAEHVRVAISAVDGELRIEVQDDGVGFDPQSSEEGFGLAGMQERAMLAGGTLRLDSGERGTLLTACLPLRRTGGGEASSSSQHAAS